MPEESRRSLEDHLVERIKESGYPLEIEISTLLDKDYLVFNTQHYFDKEMRQSRDIDIYTIPHRNIDLLADARLMERLAPFGLRTEVAIECKKSATHAWLFFTRPFIQPLSMIYTSGQYKDTFDDLEVETLLNPILFNKLALHYDDFKKAAVSHHEVKKQGNNKSRREIFKAKLQLTKFLSYEMRPPEVLPAPSDVKHCTICMFFPVIVFDGDMFEVTFEQNEPRLERKPHLLLNTHYRSPYTRQVGSFLIDVVHRSYFHEFMKILNADFIKMGNALFEKHDELAEEAEKASKAYSSKPFFASDL